MCLLKLAFPAFEDLESASVYDVAAVVLDAAQRGRAQVHFHGLLLLSDEYISGLQGDALIARRDEARLIVAEALGFLVSQNFLAVIGTSTGIEYQVTRLGKTMKSRTDFTSYAKASLLPPELLHPRLAANVRALFLTGQYDAAEFMAFKEVEVAVREIGPYASDNIGEKLMRKALNEMGPLAATFAVLSETKAFEHLFVGAIGYFKNPQSHRAVGLDDANVAALRILLAPELLTLLDFHTNLAAAAASSSSTAS